MRHEQSMKTSAVYLSAVLALALLGCKKKEDKPADPAPATGTATAPGAGTGTATAPDPGAGTATPTDPGAGAGTADPGAGTGAGTAAAGAIEDVKPLPEGMPGDCQKAHEAMVTIARCEKHPADHRAPMIKAWNMAVDSSFSRFKDASADQKKTIERSCASMVKASAMLVKDC